MQTVRLTEAQSRLPALIDAVIRGEEVVITRDDVPVARLSAPATSSNDARPSLRDHRPSSVGPVLRPPSADDDVLAEMIDDRG
jgi:antitoxin (DNA-binding transcriptional repressor) of toxin-antitoxin stability system